MGRHAGCRLSALRLNKDGCTQRMHNERTAGSLHHRLIWVASKYPLDKPRLDLHRTLFRFCRNWPDPCNGIFSPPLPAIAA